MRSPRWCGYTHYVASLKNFRPVVLKYGVTNERVGRAESKTVSHLKDWGNCRLHAEIDEFSSIGQIVVIDSP